MRPCAASHSRSASAKVCWACGRSVRISISPCFRIQRTYASCRWPHYSLAADHCYPVLLSTKKGGHALALCAHWGQPGHTALASEKHVTPKDWNYTQVCSHMAAKAPDSGKSAAGQKRKAAK